MDYYFDVFLLENPKIRANVLLNKVYMNFHKTLVDMKAIDIGVSFPEYRLMLGNVIRVHSTLIRLEELQSLSWLGELSDYCEVRNLKPIPLSVRFRNIKRQQPNMSPSALRRLIKRDTIKSEDINKYKENMHKNGLSEPYVELVSASNGKKYRRYFHFGEVSEKSISGQFDNFGTSKIATIPWF